MDRGRGVSGCDSTAAAAAKFLVEPAIVSLGYVALAHIIWRVSTHPQGVCYGRASIVPPAGVSTSMQTPSGPPRWTRKRSPFFLWPD